MKHSSIGIRKTQTTLLDSSRCSPMWMDTSLLSVCRARMEGLLDAEDAAARREVNTSPDDFQRTAAEPMDQSEPASNGSPNDLLDAPPLPRNPAVTRRDARPKGMDVDQSPESGGGTGAASCSSIEPAKYKITHCWSFGCMCGGRPLARMPSRAMATTRCSDPLSLRDSDVLFSPLFQDLVLHVQHG